VLLKPPIELALKMANYRIWQNVGKPCSIQCSLISKAEVIYEEQCPPLLLLPIKNTVISP
jgi:hypothetical protein